MPERFWRQRRRLFLCTVLWLSAGALHGWQLAVLLGAAGLLATVLVVRHAPRWRAFAMKCGVIAVPVMAALGPCAGWLDPTITALLGVGAVLFLPSQLWWLDWVRVPFITRTQARRVIARTPDQLWTALCPRETADHWDPTVRGVRSGAKPGLFVIVYEALDETGELQVPIKVFDVREGTHFKTRDLSQPNAQRGGPITVTGVTIEPAGEQSRLTLVEATWRQGLWAAFSMWLDDYVGDHMDRMAAHIEERPDLSIKGALLGTMDGA